MTYEELLQAAKSDPDGVDLQELREAFARSPQYDPYHNRQPRLEVDLERSFNRLVEEGKIEESIEVVNRLLEMRYLYIYGHRAAAYVHEKAGNKAEAAFHQKFAERLLDSILQSGDGRSYEAAFVLVDLSEQPLVLEVLGIERGWGCGWKVKSYKGSDYDILEYTNPKTGKTERVYFNIDFPRAWSSRDRNQAER